MKRGKLPLYKAALAASLGVVIVIAVVCAPHEARSSLYAQLLLQVAVAGPGEYRLNVGDIVDVEGEIDSLLSDGFVFVLQLDDNPQMVTCGEYMLQRPDGEIVLHKPGNPPLQSTRYFVTLEVDDDCGIVSSTGIASTIGWFP